MSDERFGLSSRFTHHGTHVAAHTWVVVVVVVGGGDMLLKVIFEFEFLAKCL